MAQLMDDSMRKKDMDTIYQLFITPAERRQRVLLAGKMRGLESVSAIARAMGVNWSTANGMLDRENASIRSIMKLAMALGCTIGYLTERGKG